MRIEMMVPSIEQSALNDDARKVVGKRPPQLTAKCRSAVNFEQPARPPFASISRALVRGHHALPERGADTVTAVCPVSIANGQAAQRTTPVAFGR
jgi:hypothetical protein